MNRFMCTYEECDNNDPTKGCKSCGCRFGRFHNLVTREFGDYGNWKFREFSSGAICATIKGYAGRVEFWGGNHFWEVYAIPKGTKDKDIPRAETLKTIREVGSAIDRACALVGVQQRIGTSKEV